MATDPNCIFCKIAAGQIPCAKVLEDGGALAFVDIGPLAKGHVLLIPRQHYQTLDQMPADVAAAMLGHLPGLVKAVQSATGCQGVNVLQNNGRVAHQEVPHVHFHIIPRNSGDAFHFNWPAGVYPQGEIEQVAKAIAAKMG
jgi:histidine triad (HIT) family protein